jgi:catechol 2,3-dioxygenase-like lactoylglutathione lyase family enzyme
MPTIKDIAFVTYQVTDLDKTEAFLTDFGMVRGERTANALYMRGANDSPYIHVSVKGDTAKLLSVAFELVDTAGLEEAAKLPGASPIEAIGGPGGGQRVRLAAPSNYIIELVHGRAPVPQRDIRTPYKYNHATERQRPNTVQRPGTGPADIVRMSHVALYVDDVVGTVEWAKASLGMIVSDYVDVPDKGELAATFLRANRGSTPTDHHTLAIIGNPKKTIHHCSYEALDWDSLHRGHGWLASRGHSPEHGIGRHTLGSQVFDYWRDPDGFLCERFIDGDVFDNTVEPRHVPASMDAFFQWGPQPKPSFFD